MRIPRYWAKASHQTKDNEGAPLKISCNWWSDSSLEEARSFASRHALEVAKRVSSGVALNQYSYGDRPLREERMREVLGENGEPAAVITRNSYGSLILNTRRVMFLDFDAPETSRLSKSIKRLFGFGSSFEEEVLSRITSWIKSNPNFGLRLYQTAKGYRGLVSHAYFDPKSQSTENTLVALGCDPLYLKLCKTQECFRARLTPKYWRCRDIPAPPNRFPWESSSEERKFREWERMYKEKSARYATCKFISNYGASNQAAEARIVIEEHDKVACAGDLANLA